MQETIKTLLVDDEKNSREVLEKLLRKYCSAIEVIGEASNVEDAYDLVLQLNPQLVFLDIQMPRANGFSLLKKFTKVPFEVIFATSFDRHAITAIKFNALDYLLKPIDVDDLQAAVHKMASKLIEKKDNQPLILNLLQNLESEMSARKFPVHSGEKVKMLSEQDIVYIKGEGRYSHIHVKEGLKYTTAKNLKDFEDFFGPDSTLVRISKTFILNVSFIKEYSKGEPFILTMFDKTNFEVARRKKTEILDKLKMK